MKLVKILLVLLVLLALSLLGVGLFIDGLAKSAIQTASSEALGVETRVETVRIGFFSSTFSLKGLAVDNPKDIGEGQFLSLGDGSVELSTMSLLGDTVTVPELTLKDITVHLIKTAKGSNYETILDNLDRFQGGSGSAGGSSGGGAAGESSESEGKRFIINKLLIENVKVKVEPAKELNLGAVEVPIDRIELKDIGSESDKGVLLSDLTGIVIEAILKKASVSGQLPNMIQGALDGKLGDLSGLQDAGINALDGVLGGGASGVDPKKTVDDAKKALKDGLKGLGIGR